jgi:phosphatidylserine/phosphatidylglycerophosphate/cardiolipin synthase-like enzyme
MILDVCIDLLRGGFVSVDRGTGRLAVVPAVLECMGSPDSPRKDWQHDLTSAAPPEPREYRLMQDLVSGSLFPAVGPPPKGRRFPVAPVSLDLPRIEEIPKADLMLAVALAVRSRQEVSESESVGSEIERTHYLHRHRVIDVTIPRRGGPTADPNGEVNSVRAQMIVAARPRMSNGDETPAPVFRIVGPTSLPGQIRQRIALGLRDLWEAGVAREPDQFFARLRYDEEETDLEEEAALPITGPAARLHDLESVIATAIDEPHRHEEISEADQLADAEIVAVAGFGSRVEVIVGAAAHHDLVLDALRTAQEQVVLACPWVGQLATNDALRAALVSAAGRGVRIHLLWGVTKGERREDVFKGDSWEFLSRFAPGKAAGCIYVADRPSGCHAKLITCDLDWAVVTSSNFLNSGRERQTQEVGVRVFSRLGAPPKDEERGTWTIADRRPVVARVVIETVEWARLVTPDYRVRRSISSDPVLFGRREDTSGVQLGGGALAPDPSNPLSVSLWKNAWNQRLAEHRSRLSATGMIALPVRDAEHRHLLLHALASASQRVVVASPELGVGALGSYMVDALKSARSRGVTVTLVFAEERIRDAIRFSDRRRELEAAGVSLCKLDTHAKLLVCDDWAVVTSFNFLSFEGYYDNDRRARHEFGIRVLDGTVADNLVELLGLARA